MIPHRQTGAGTMMLHFCVTLIQLTALASGTEAGDSYKEAHRQMTATGKPLVVMVGTDWCGPCQAMKKTVLPKVREHGLFRKVSFAMVNADREQELAQQITGGGPVPQLILYRKTRKGWFRQKLIGSQSVETVEKFIQDGLAQEQSKRKTKSGDAAKDTAATPKKSKKSSPEEKRPA
jgi:thioredoxin-like negative regulator of GroEL